MSQDVTEYLSRRRAVAKYEREEVRSRSVEEKLGELARLMSSATAMAAGDGQGESDSAIWARWNRLRQALSSADGQR